jgi:hypothetical protein
MDNRIQRYTVLGIIAVCTLISAILADSLLGVWSVEIGEPIPGAWKWLLGDTTQSFRTQTVALLVGVVLLGFAFGGVWFFIGAGYRWLRRQLAST